MKCINKLILINLTALVFFALPACQKSSSDDIPSSYSSLESFIEDGYFYYQDGDYNTAVECFNAALERDVDPELSIRAYRGLGWTYSRIGQPAKAVNNFNFLISAENIRTGKDPILKKNSMSARLRDLFGSLNFADTAGIGLYNLDIDSTDFLLSVSSIASYAGKTEERITVGDLPNIIKKGSDIIPLLHSVISNLNGDGPGSPMDVDISFSVAENSKEDSFTVKVSETSLISEYYHYYVDAEAGLVTIMPRYWEMEKLKVAYSYYSNSYGFKFLNGQSISLKDILSDD
ncbi:tetratricopeptide repeat protein, partial [bacterium]|nr:tetratricopeptide repeat protein [bacterium]